MGGSDVCEGVRCVWGGVVIRGAVRVEQGETRVCARSYVCGGVIRVRGGRMCVGVIRVRGVVRCGWGGVG